MKRFFIILLAAAFCLTGCEYWFGCGEEKERQVVLVYMAGNNSLSFEGESDFQEVLDAFLPSSYDDSHILLAFCHFIDQTPVLKRISRDGNGSPVEEIVREFPFDTNSATAQTLSLVCTYAHEAYPAERNGLVLWSHGTGFLPPGYYANPIDIPDAMDACDSDAAYDPYAGLVKSFAEDHGKEISLDGLRGALSGNVHYDFILFDCCLMANVEVGFELWDCADYLLFSPTEILSDGFPYDSMMQTLFSMPAEEAMLKVAQDYMAHYRALEGVYRSATICLLTTRDQALQKLAAACKPVFENHRDQILTLDRSKVQPYFRFEHPWFYDIDDFVGQVADDDEYRAFTAALQNAVLFKDATEKFLSIDIKHYSGLSIYIPRTDYTVLNNYYRTLRWNQASDLVR